MEAHLSMLRPARLDTDPSSPTAAQEWQHWHTTVENYFKAAKVTEDADKQLFLVNFVSPKVWSFISDSKTFPLAIKALNDIYDKKKNILYSRHLLSTTRQQPNQSLDDYLISLKHISRDCGFKPLTALEHCEDSILNAFVSGISSNFIRQRLLENDTLTLSAAFNQARTLEVAQRNAENYQSQSQSFTPVSSVVQNDDHPAFQQSAAAVKYNQPSGHYNRSGNSGSNNQSFGSSDKCWFCGRDRHPRAKCPARNDDCKTCGKKGHWWKFCNSKSGDGKTAGASAAIVSPRYIPPRLAASSSNYNRTVMEDVLVEGVKAEALLDTGAGQNFMDKDFASRNKISFRPVRYTVGLAQSSCTGEVIGLCEVTLSVKGDKYQRVKMSIMKDLVSEIVLGEDFMEEHSVVEFHFGGSKPPLVLSGLPPMKLVLPPMFADLPPNVKPIATKSRGHSKCDQSFIADEVKRLLELDVIEPSKSPWRAQVLVDRNEGKKPRMVIDYSRTINTYTIPDAYPIPRIDNMVNDLAKYSRFTAKDLRSAYHLCELPESDWEYTAFEAGGRLYHFKRLPFGLTNAVAAFQRLMDKLIDDHNLKGVYVYIDNITIAGETQEIHDYNLRRFMEVAKSKNLTFNEGKTILNTDSITLLGYQISHKLLKPDPERAAPLLNLPVPTSVASLKRAIGLFAYYAKWIPRYSDRIRPLLQCKSLPLGSDAVQAFNTLKSVLAQASLLSIDEDIPFTIESDASNFCLAATLNQGGRPVAFHSRTLSGSEMHHSSVEKEAAAVMDAIRRWYHLLVHKQFTIVTDQRSVAFMFNKKHPNNIKNHKLMRWRMELAPLKYTIIYRSGEENCAADALSRPFCATISDNSLYKLHESLGHPGITRTLHFVRSRNLPYSVEDVKRIVGRCKVCLEVKPRFYKPVNQHLIEATRPFQRLNIDFKGPIPSCSRNKYFMTVVDEYSRYPWAFPCSDMTGSSVIKCFTNIFSEFGMPDYVHSDRGSNFLSIEVKSYLNSLGIASSKTTPYNPRGNGQTERFNGIIWNTILLLLKSKNLPVTQWESVITEALHSVRSLLCTATNCTPHERLFTYSRKTASGSCLPQWLTTPGGTVLLRRYERGSKYEPLVEKAELIQCNPQYAQIRLENGRETTVSLRDLAPYTDNPGDPILEPDHPEGDPEDAGPHNQSVVSDHDVTLVDQVSPRKSGRVRVAPDRLGYT